MQKLNFNKKNMLSRERNDTLSIGSSVSKSIEISHTNNSSSFNKNEKIILSIIKVLKIRISIENIPSRRDDEYWNIIENNLNLIDLKHMEINSINRFVDDLIEIFKIPSNDDNPSDELIKFEKEDYRPITTSEEKFLKRRPIEFSILLHNISLR